MKIINHSLLHHSDGTNFKGAKIRLIQNAFAQDTRVYAEKELSFIADSFLKNRKNPNSRYSKWLTKRFNEFHKNSVYSDLNNTNVFKNEKGEILGGFQYSYYNGILMSPVPFEPYPQADEILTSFPLLSGLKKLKIFNFSLPDCRHKPYLYLNNLFLDPKIRNTSASVSALKLYVDKIKEIAQKENIGSVYMNLDKKLFPKEIQDKITKILTNFGFNKTDKRGLLSFVAEKDKFLQSFNK